MGMKYDKLLDRVKNYNIYNNALHRALEKRIWNKIFKKNTIESYKIYLVKCPKRLYINEALMNIEIIEWTKAKKENTIDAYKIYLEQYSNGLYKDDALKNTETIRWNNLKEIGTINAGERYLRIYPSGLYVKEAKQLINDLIQLKKTETKKAIFFVVVHMITLAILSSIVCWSYNHILDIILNTYFAFVGTMGLAIFLAASIVNDLQKNERVGYVIVFINIVNIIFLPIVANCSRI